MEKDYISIEEAQTLPGLFEARLKRSPDKPAFRQFDADANEWVERTWSQFHKDAACWQGALDNEGLKAGDRVGIMVRNSIEWALLDIAALSSGLVVVPIFIKESHENIRHILNDAQVRLLVVEDADLWDSMAPIHANMPNVERILIVKKFAKRPADLRVKFIGEWLCTEDTGIYVHDVSPDTPATIVYTSGTTGLPKGAVLTHHNILWNAVASLECVDVLPNDVFLSFLPLTHMFERTAGYYLPMAAGSKIVYARNVRTVAEDMLTQHPTVLVCVPLVLQRIYERVMDEVGKGSPAKQALFKLALDAGWANFEHTQGRGGWKPVMLLNPLLGPIVAGKVLAKMGGRLRVVVCGGAPMAYVSWKLFVSLGLPVIQGYGMTETSPVISVNRIENNRGESVGPLLRGVKARITPEGEIVVRTPGAMKGYWNNEEATRAIIDAEGWVHTGDVGEIKDDHLMITDRLKQIIVMSNGEKVPPERVEMALKSMLVFENVMIVGEKRPILLLLAKANMEKLAKFAAEKGVPFDGEKSLADERLHAHLMEEANRHLTAFPGYVRVKRLHLTSYEWLPDNGMLTNTLKLRRKVIEQKLKAEIEKAFAGV